MQAEENVTERSGNCRGIQVLLLYLLRDLWLSRSYHTYKGLLSIRPLVRRVRSLLGGRYVAGGSHQKRLSDLQPR